MRVVDVSPMEGFWIRATFSDGAIKEIGLEDVFNWGEVFASVRESRELFEGVRVNRQMGVVEWPGEVDLDSDVLYGRFEPASGVHIERRTVKAPSASAA